MVFVIEVIRRIMGEIFVIIGSLIYFFFVIMIYLLNMVLYM